MRVLALVVLVATLAACSSAPPTDEPLPDSAFRTAAGGIVYDEWPDVARRPYPGAGQNGMPPGFVDELVFGGLTAPTAVRFLPDGTVLVTEQAGVVQHAQAVPGATPRMVLDLRTEVFGNHQLGLVGLAVDPDYPTQPYVYLAYTRDAVLGGDVPTYGAADPHDDGCASRHECPASARLVRYRVGATPVSVVGDAEVLIDDWCVTAPNHTVGTLAFGPDGALYVGAGDGADGVQLDYGQLSVPANGCADPPGGVGDVPSPPAAEGGSLRSQDAGRGVDPVGLSGTIIRVDRVTGDGLADNPLARSTDGNARRVIAYGLRNPFRFTFRPGTSELWLTDVGWNTYEEVNRLTVPPDGGPANFGWPCFEGPSRQPAFEALNLDVCADLYADESQVTFPAFSFARGADEDQRCETPGSSTSGIAFYDGESFPERFLNAMFLVDLPRRCLFVMEAGDDGLPDPRTVRIFARPVRATDLVVGPDGALYYPDYSAGELRRISYRPS